LGDTTPWDGQNSQSGGGQEKTYKPTGAQPQGKKQTEKVGGRDLKKKRDNDGRKLFLKDRTPIHKAPNNWSIQITKSLWLKHCATPETGTEATGHK